MRDPLVYWAITSGIAYGAAADGRFDVVHSHLDFHAFTGASLVATPTVTTLHGRLDPPDLPRLYSRFPDMPVISISDNQREPLPQARWAGTVYNAGTLGMHSFSEVKVLYGPGNRNRDAKARASPRGEV